MFVIKLILVMGWVRGYGNYRSEKQREGPLFIFSVPRLCVICPCSFFLGVFWGGIRYTLHVFSGR